MPRLFTALEVPADLALRLSFLKGGLRGARWIVPDNFHITLRFIGDVEGPVADAIAESLARIDRPRFDLTVDGLGSFGTRKPHSLWARVVPDTALLELQAEQERVIQRAGLPPEGRKYTPHITLARLRGATQAETAGWLALRGEFGPVSFPITRFVLLSSRASVGGGPYIVEDAYDLLDSAA
ncbi:MAG: RNA 2',3'-cyclic phosphodiesterase [Pseudomonadota bacterium]